MPIAASFNHLHDHQPDLHLSISADNRVYGYYQHYIFNSNSIRRKYDCIVLDREHDIEKSKSPLTICFLRTFEGEF